MKVYICNTTIMVADGVYKMGGLENPKKYLEDILAIGGEIYSAVGHESTAQICAALLDMDIRVNRITLDADNLKVGDQMLCIKLKSRPPEAKILSIKEIKKIGYEWKLIERLK